MKKSHIILSQNQRKILQEKIFSLIDKFPEINFLDLYVARENNKYIISVHGRYGNKKINVTSEDEKYIQVVSQLKHKIINQLSRWHKMNITSTHALKSSKLKIEPKIEGGVNEQIYNSGY